MGKTLVVYYSRTGRCEKIAEYLAELLKCDMDRLRDKADYTGKKGLFLCSVKAIFRQQTALAPTKFDPAYYDDVILVSPIWAGKSCPAIRTYVSGRQDKFQRVSLVTCGGLSCKKGIKHELTGDFGVKLYASIGLTVDEVDADTFGHRLRAFILGEQGVADEDSNAASSPNNAHKESCAHCDSSEKDAIPITIDDGSVLAETEIPYGTNPYYAYPPSSPEPIIKENKMKNTNTTSNVNPATKNSNQNNNTKDCTSQANGSKNNTNAKSAANNTNATKNTTSDNVNQTNKSNQTSNTNQTNSANQSNKSNKSAANNNQASKSNNSNNNSNNIKNNQ